jgi:hypothetical protein
MCCAAKQTCAAGFKVNGATGTEQECKTAGKAVSSSASCAGDACAAAAAGTADDATCCVAPQTCAAGFKVNGATGTKQECKTAGKVVSSTASCALHMCAAAAAGTVDDGTCCVAKQTCAAGFQISTGTASGKATCKTAGKVVSSSAVCAGDVCANAAAGTLDDGLCCVDQMTCANGFQLNTATGTEKIACAKDLELQTANCAGSACVDATDKAACCKAKNATADVDSAVMVSFSLVAALIPMTTW